MLEEPKFGICNSLFCDALIIVEGYTEETLLPFYISRNDVLKHEYIAVVNIGGAHAYVYEKLLKTLKIPVVIITDLDIKRDDTDEQKFISFSSLKDKTTSNNTIKHFNGNKEQIGDISFPILSDNIAIFSQGCYDGLYKTSFEEAFISKNKDNKIVNEILKELKPRIYDSIVGTNNPCYENNSVKSYEWQIKLSNCKTEFSNQLLYKMLISEDNIPELPDYIQYALDYIKNKL